MSIETFEKREELLKMREKVFIYHIANAKTEYNKLFNSYSNGGSY